MQEVTGQQEDRNSKAMHPIWPDFKESKIKLRI